MSSQESLKPKKYHSILLFIIDSQRGVIEEISSFQDNVTTWLPINLGTDKTTGLEYNMKYTPNKWMTLKFRL